VRREDLDERSSVASFDEDEEAQQKLRDALSRKLAGSLSWEIVIEEQPAPKLKPRPVDGSVDGAAADDDETEDEEPPEEFEFKLFGTTRPATKIVLEKFKPFKPGQGTIVAWRPAAYYFAGPTTPRQRAQYEAALVTWDQLMETSRRRFWGLERPWRTIAKIDNTSKAKVSAKQGQRGGSSSTIVAEGTADDGKKRGRPGKKTRIAMRKRERVAKSKMEADEKARAAKEESLKAKKKRLNHTKKLRLRAKAKEKKIAAKAGAADASGGPGSPSSTAVADTAMEDV
jgi:hypothetical protein